MSEFFVVVVVVVVLFSSGGAFAMDLSPVQGALQHCRRGFIVSEVNSESEQAKGPKP
jgi:hypothetical protein